LYILDNIWKSHLRYVIFELAESTKSYGKYEILRKVPSVCTFEVITHPFTYIAIHKAMLNE